MGGFKSFTSNLRRGGLITCTVLVLTGILPVRAAQAGTGVPAAPPVLVSDVRQGTQGSSPANLMSIGSTLFFSASDGLSGRELWKTDPPYKSARRVSDICPGGCDSNPTYLAVSGTTLLFNATDGKTGYELWRSEPPYDPSSTFLAADINPTGDSFPQEIISIGTAVFFSASDGKSGRELWRSNQPFHEAVRIENIFPGGAGSDPRELTSIGWMLFFSADDSSGREVWRSDPPYTSASTFKNTQINPTGSANAQELTASNLKLFFSATDGETGQELYLLDSPYHEARRVTDVAGTPLSANPTDLYPVGDTLFFTASIGFVGVELFRSDPPYENTSTYLQKDIYPGLFRPFPAFPAVPYSSDPQEKTSIGTTLFFAATDAENGRELWKAETPYSDEDKTQLVMDIRKGKTGSNPQALYPLGTTLFFTANDGEHGTELWKSEPPYDDTSTTLVSDIDDDPTSSNPHSLYAVGNTLFFAATIPNYGKELLRYGGAYAMPATGFAPGKITRVGIQPASKSYQSMDEINLDIPAIGVKTSVVGVPVSPDGWDLSWLNTQVGYLTGTAYPTWDGNTVLTAHVYLADGSPGPFANLSKLSWGSQVVLRAFGQRYIYEVRAVQSVSSTDTEQVFRHEERPWLTLVTCQGYDASKDSYRSRLVVRAVLVKVAPEP